MNCQCTANEQRINQRSLFEMQETLHAIPWDVPYELDLLSDGYVRVTWNLSFKKLAVVFYGNMRGHYEEYNDQQGVCGAGGCEDIFHLYDRIKAFWTEEKDEAKGTED